MSTLQADYEHNLVLKPHEIELIGNKVRELGGTAEAVDLAIEWFSHVLALSPAVIRSQLPNQS